MMQITEELLWRYIDGECTATERGAIESQLSADPDLRATYADLLAYHTRLIDLMRERRSRRASDPGGSIEKLARDYDVFGSVRSN